MLTIDSARPEERAAAFRLVFGHLQEAERTVWLAQAQALVSRGELDPAGILVARVQEELVGAMAAIVLPGAAGLVWPPGVKDGPEKKSAQDQLMQRACAWLQSRQARLAHALSPSWEKPSAEVLVRNGFLPITRLVYFHHDLQELDFPSPPCSFRCLTYNEVDPRLFQAALLRTYEGTLDCPELNGVRTVEEILEGHRGQGKFDPQRWWLGFVEGQAVGLALALELAEGGGWDLSYLGVVPEARGRGIGRAMVQLSLLAARSAGASGLCVAVDIRNRPAWNLYGRLGFQPGESRELYLAIFSRPEHFSS